ncbi:choice-of-anchor M domain-containing protein [Microbacterium sp. SORGH_AS_0888]|uniref:choice-of-anchor M domain-containing protein n=1 Tax=Microbacterium sp. SORGH_AS_0888 TaxID=3041791 RepID=UPI00277DD104|nr:choice-of-anchor M domain-containing protein [Microbacterium sp. SORGH_AS_0888]MDQ1128251.1 surface-anchored protein [Microbacterium sp. SORGH_AS_0888]
MGPRFVDGRWTFLIHDDVAKADASATSVWRYPDETVFHVVDAGELTAPDDPAYAFLGAAPGSTVWVSPQTQNPQVVWIGWNTQDPDVMAQIDRGITLTLHRVEGPGTMTVFLQSGSFGEPQVLWDSRTQDPQPVWVDVNTHTHANWAFTAPGVYLVELEASADLIDGSTVSDTQTIRLAVGSRTAPDDALAAAWSGPRATAAEAASHAAESSDAQDPLVPVLVGAIVVVAAGLVAGVVVVVVRGNRARRRALARSTEGRS